MHALVLIIIMILVKKIKLPARLIIFANCLIYKNPRFLQNFRMKIPKHTQSAISTDQITLAILLQKSPRQLLQHVWQYVIKHRLRLLYTQTPNLAVDFLTVRHCKNTLDVSLKYLYKLLVFISQ